MGRINDQWPKNGPAGLDPALEEIHGAQEIDDKRRGWMMEDFLGRAGLLDLAVVHQDDAVSHFEGLLLVVRDKHTGDVNFVVKTP